MQQPGEAAVELARQQSTLARVLARGRGLPLPFLPRAPVQNSPTGKGWTSFKDMKSFELTGGVFAVCAPVFIPLGACIVVCRFLTK